MVKNRKRINLGRIVGYSSLGLLSLLTLALLLPNVKQESQALECEEGEAACYTTMSTTEIGVTASTAISLAMSPSVRMEVVPTSTGATSSASTKLAVSTNSKDGYALYMQTGNSTGDLLSTSTTNTTSKISNTTLTDTSLEGLEKNTYGYAISTTAPDSSTKYSTLPTTGGVIQKTDSTTGSNGDNYIYGDAYYLAFGTKIGTDLEAGSYTGTVTVSAVANPKTLASMFDLTYMQEMTSDICTNTREGYTKQLIDTRDGKSYWVAKLKDGNCWMTQNLAYTITQEMIDNNSINSTNTDLHPNDSSLTGAGQLYTDEATGITYWNNNEEVTYKPKTVNEVILNGNSFGRDAMGTNSWTFGSSLQATPELGKGCVDADGKYLLISGYTPGEVCAFVGFIDLDKTWKPTFTAQEGTWTFEDGTTYTGLVTVDKNAKTYDAHYLMGTYYQGNAAMAGTAGTMLDGDAPSSLCPSGWKMPIDRVVSLGGNESLDVDGTFGYLFKYYYPTYSHWFYDREGGFDVVRLPIALTPYGSIYVGSASANGIGRSAAYYTATAIDNGTNHSPISPFLIITTNDRHVWLSRYDDGRASGRQVRCLAR